MRALHGAIVPGALIAAAAFASQGCTPSPGATGQSAYTPPPSATGSPPAAAGPFLAAGHCAARVGSGRGTAFHDVPCGDPAAVARVTVRRATGDAGAPNCPATTDLVLAVTEGGSAADHPVGGSHGYACLRNLRAPHPGDPGAGGGPNTIVGDCVYAARSDQARETACDGSMGHRPQYKVVLIADTRADCPPGTSLYVGLFRGQVGCAVPL